MTAEQFRGEGLRIAVVHSRFNDGVVSRLLAGAVKRLRELGVDSKATHVESVPGAFELPLAALTAGRSGRFDAVVALGCVIRGDTDHYRLVCDAATHGLLRASLDSGVPVAFGVLTVDEEEQALRRSAPSNETGDAGDNNKGAEAASVAIEMVHRLRRLRGN